MKIARRKLSLLPSRLQSSKAKNLSLQSAASQLSSALANAPEFLALPSEIRNHIYALLFRGSVTTYRGSKNIVGNKVRRYITSTSSVHFIALACKQCYQECYELFYTETLIDLSQLPNPYQTVEIFLSSPPPAVMFFVTQLSGIPFPSVLASRLDAFQSLKQVAVILPKLATTHILESTADESVRNLENEKIYDLLKVRPDWGLKQAGFRYLIERYPEMTFTSTMTVDFHESKRYVETGSYESFALPCQYDPHGDKLICFKNDIRRLGAESRRQAPPLRNVIG